MRINHNIAALNTYRQLTGNQAIGNKSLARLSSGLRINSAADDAAGLTMSEKMRGQIRGLEQATRNAQDGVSLIQTAEGALNETHSILQRIRELAVQSANDTNTSTDRTEIQKEVDQLAKEITRIANNTEFNTQNLLNGAIQSSGVGELTFQIGANATQSLGLAIKAMDAYSLGVASNKVDVADGAVDITAASVSSGATGTSLTYGAVLTFSAAANGTAANGTVTVGGLTIDTTTNTSEINGVTIAFTDGGDGASVSGAYDSDTNTITITGDFDDTDTGGVFSSNADIETEINSQLTAAGYVAQVTISAGTASAATGSTSGAIASGQGDWNITVTDANSNTEIIDMATAQTSGSFTGSNFSGLSITADGSLTASASATATVYVASDASFSGGALSSDATVGAGIDVSTQSAADVAITNIQSAIETVSAERSKLGAYQNRLEHTINNLGTASENLSASESRIRDVDMAKEMMEFTKMNILSQAAQAMLAQANQMPQQVLQLLR